MESVADAVAPVSCFKVTDGAIVTVVSYMLFYIFGMSR